jgi:hypothetical protein
MNEYDFTLVIEGGLIPERLEVLFEAGSSDMTFQGDEAGPVSADVHRVARSLVDAVLAAVGDTERVPGLRVVQVEGQDLVGWQTLLGDWTGAQKASDYMLARDVGLVVSPRRPCGGAAGSSGGGQTCRNGPTRT